MKKILVVALSLLSLCGYSQPVTIGVRGGLSIPNIIAGGDNNPLSKGYSSRIAGTGGVFAELDMNSLLSLRLGVEYSGQGGNRNGTQAMSSNQLMAQIAQLADIPGMPAGVVDQLKQLMPGTFYADVKNTAKFNYLMVPLSLQAGTNFGSSKTWRAYVGAGPFVSFLLSAEQVSKGKSKLYVDPAKSQTLWDAMPPMIQQMAPALEYALGSETEFGTADIKEDLRKVNAGIQGNVGLAYQCDRSKVFLEVGGNYGFVKLQKDASNGSNRLGAAAVTLGYAYRLGK